MRCGNDPNVGRLLCAVGKWAGAEGVHLVMSYTPASGAPEETIDQTSYLSDGKDAVYLLVVRCTTTETWARWPPARSAGWVGPSWRS